MKKDKVIIGWKEVRIIVNNVGINNEQFQTIINYEPIFESEKKENEKQNKND